MVKLPHKCLTFTSPEAWRAWLEEHHATDREAWLLHSKKNAARRFLTYDEALEEALCFGWIDGTLKPVDDETFVLRYSPRRSRSIWSVNNQQRVERLIQEGRMTTAGLEKIAEAKENGEWEAAIARENVDAIPEDLLQELKRYRVWTSFKKWPTSKKKQYLYWLNSAKRPETRQKRIQAIVEMAGHKNLE
jgi:uncharacterized protein YdeI (YjbR/CyaY-like superfamily)